MKRDNWNNAHRTAVVARSFMAAAVAATMIGSCRGSSVAEELITPVRVFKSTDCAGFAEAGALWIETEARWQEIFARMTSQRTTRTSPPMVDFTRERVLVMAMGRRMTGGFEIEAAAQPATVTDSVLTIDIEWREPAPDAFLTQALTSPCVAVKLPNGAYRTIEVIDQAGNVRAEVTLP
jgi:hypothetical protein